jgi:hypothetical protein
MQGDGFSCSDIDECDLGTHKCAEKSSICTNITPNNKEKAGYVCECAKGLK